MNGQRPARGGLRLGQLARPIQVYESQSIKRRGDFRVVITKEFSFHGERLLAGGFGLNYFAALPTQRRGQSAEGNRNRHVLWSVQVPVQCERLTMHRDSLLVLSDGEVSLTNHVSEVGFHFSLAFQILPDALGSLVQNLAEHDSVPAVGYRG